MKKSIKEVLAFKELSEEEKKERGILGRLYGPCADFINPTRNGRKYSDELWEKVFQSDLVKEAFANGGIFGELDHPADRSETCSEKIAICMPEPPKRDNNGHLIAYFDILDTPNGRIAYALAKYGYKLGISSRGNGDVYEDEDGGESVDPDSYEFNAFDLVITPSVKDARLSMTESLEKSVVIKDNMDEYNKHEAFKKELKESLERSSDNDRRIMEETIDHLASKELLEAIAPLNEECNSENCTDKLDEESKQTVEEEKEVVDNESKALLDSLQEAIKAKSQLEAQVRDLQEKLAVSNAKVDQVSEDLKKARSAMIAASTEASKSTDLSKKVSTLEEALKQKTQTIADQEKTINELAEKQAEEIKKSNSLNESVSKKSSEIVKLNESLDKAIAEKDATIKALNESLESEKKINLKKVDDLTKDLNKESTLKESYKKLAYNAVNRYIESKALMLGVSSAEIKNKLEKRYSLDDVDRICEDLQAYQVNINKLPFNIDRKVKMRVTESKKDPLYQHNPDDEVDTDFLDGISI